MNLPAWGARRSPPEVAIALLERSRHARSSSSFPSTAGHAPTESCERAPSPSPSEPHVRPASRIQGRPMNVLEEDELLSAPEATPTPPQTAWHTSAWQWVQVKCPEAWSLFREAAPVACGSVAILVLVGRLLSRVTQWEAFVRVDTLLVLVPVLLNALGNTAMTLSLRLATAAHGSLLNLQKERQKLLKANMALLLFQATVVATLAGAGAFGLRQLLPPEDQTRPPLAWTHRLALVLSVASGAGILSAFVVGQALCATVVLGPRLGLDADNLAAPVAAGLGDLMTLLLVALAGAGLLSWAEASIPLGPILVLFIALSAGTACGVHAFHQPETRPLLFAGWTPLLGAAALASGSGLVLDSQAHDFPGYANIAPVLAGLAGNCAAILLSRESTRLHYTKCAGAHLHAFNPDTSIAVDTDEEPEIGHHQSSRQGEYLALGGQKDEYAYRHPVEGWVSASVLLLVGWGVGGAYLAYLLCSPTSQVGFGPAFAGCLMCALVLTVGAGLALAHLLGLFFWRRGYDPDTYALPIVAALVDVMSQLLLSVAFSAAAWLGDAPRSLAPGSE